MSHILGISAGFHDAAVTMLSPAGDIVFAAHSERYSKIKNDANLHKDLVQDLVNVEDCFRLDAIAYYERPLYKQARQWYSGQGIEWTKLSTRRIVQDQLKIFDISSIPVRSYNHHLSHAAAGFQTSPFDRATVVVIDAIGEWDTISIWGAEYNALGQVTYKRLWRQRYPHSIGLFYSAMTQRCGLKPNEEEYITMGMAAYGSNVFDDVVQTAVIENEWEIRLKQNLHLGFAEDFCKNAGVEEMAHSAQNVAEILILNVMYRAKKLGWSNNLVYMGGVALNCSANKHIGAYFDNIWIMPNPGDAGSSLGAAALAFGKKVNWRDAFLGRNIAGAYPVNAILDVLLSEKIVGVASGRAEFGPRALGNRSLLADPRGPEIKDQVNEIKRRQKFRPFAPVILEEYAAEYFDMPRGWATSPYMQSVARCRHPDLFPAIVHHDGTSRVQTVARDGSGIRELLEKWFVMTGCPMLLNTSLNIRGEPMVNDRADADRFEKLYGVRVCS
jgi:carbamoyltransferase